MKKTHFILLFMSSLISVAQVNQTTYTFDTTTESFVQNIGNLAATPTGFLTFTPSTYSSYARITQQGPNYIDADIYKFVHVRLSNQSAENNVLNFAKSNGGSVGTVTISTEDGATFKDYVIELSNINWTGNQSNFRLYPREAVSKKNQGGAIIFDHIIFSSGATLVEFDKKTPKQEMRAVFMPTVYGLSWPSDRTDTPVEQKAELLSKLQDISANNYNTVYFQVRSECDAFYNSSIEPWSYWLTGDQGTAPNPLWDPLEYAITESHKLGLDLHAWINPYRAKRNGLAHSPEHVMTTHTDWVFETVKKTTNTDGSITYENTGDYILNPGLQVVREYVVSIITDISTRYDIDGIHFDDYFYPSNKMNPIEPQDEGEHVAYNTAHASNPLDIDDWRRDNVNKLVEMVYDTIQSINSSANKNIAFGISPFGIWKSGYPAGITGDSSYNSQYCDAIAWMAAKKVDYIAPQLYWEFTGKQDFDALIKWWEKKADSLDTPLYASLAYHKLKNDSWHASEIQRQIDSTRTLDGVEGMIAFRSNAITDNQNGINDSLTNAQFSYKAFPPPILGVGKDNICPLKPTNKRLDSLTLKWDTPAAASDGDLPIKYVVYAFKNGAEELTNRNDGSKILDIVVGNELDITQEQIDNTGVFVVTSLDKNNNESNSFENYTLATKAGNKNIVSSIIVGDTDFTVYPVPFEDQINIKLPNSYAENNIYVQLLDFTGKTIYNKKHVPYNQKVHINGLSRYKNGSYFINILNANKKIIQQMNIIKME